METTNAGLNDIWERRIKERGVDFVSFVSLSSLPEEMTLGYPRAVLFGKALSKDYIRAIRDDRKPATNEFGNTERKMDALAVKISEQLESEGYKSIGKTKTGILPHKTVALRAGLGFIGKNNLLVTPQYGCAVVLGKVLTCAPFDASACEPAKPQCGDCDLCVTVCPSDALLGKTWDITVKREEIMTRKLCVLCLKCMAACPHTAKCVCEK